MTGINDRLDLALLDERYRAQVRYLFDNSQFYRQKLTQSGFDSPEAVGGLDKISRLPLTEKDELRASRTEENPIGTHLACSLQKVARIYSTSGTTGAPSFIPLTANDVSNWVTISARSYGTSGIAAGERIITSYNAGPFAAGAALGAFDKLGLCHLPMGTGNTERLISAIRMLRADAVVVTPSYALHLAEWAKERDIDLATSSIARVLVAGEPGGGEARMRRRLEEAWGARVTEALGIGDIAVSLWGECEHQTGMHFGGSGTVHPELIDPVSGEAMPFEDGARGELVYTHLLQEAAPLLRFRSRDHVEVWSGRCSCGRETPRMRCIGRTDDMLIVRGVNVFPTAVREVVNELAPAVSGVILIRPTSKGVKQEPPLLIDVEIGQGAENSPALAEEIENRIRGKLVVRAKVQLVPHGSLPRSEYKSKLVKAFD